MVQADFDLHAHDVQTHPLTNNLPEAEECYRKKGNSPLLNGLRGFLGRGPLSPSHVVLPVIPRPRPL